MKDWMDRIVITGLLLLSSVFAYATVSEYTQFYVPYARVQSESVCLSRQIMEAEFGIPLASLMSGIFSETRTLHQNLGGQDDWKNINLLASGTTRIPWNLNFDRYNANGVYDYSFTLDMGAFATLYGGSVDGRQKTRDTAKLAIIAILRTAEQMHGAGRFRVWIRFNNLPSQNGLSGTGVNMGSVDWPGWPYTSSSVLYRSYLAEMIGSEC